MGRTRCMGRRSLGSEDVDGGPAGSSGRLAARPAVEVVPDGGAGAVLVLVGLGHEGHGQVHVAALRRRLDQLVHPGERERETRNATDHREDLGIREKQAHAEMESLGNKETSIQSLKGNAVGLVLRPNFTKV